MPRGMSLPSRASDAGGSRQAARDDPSKIRAATCKWRRSGTGGEWQPAPKAMRNLMDQAQQDGRRGCGSQNETSCRLTVMRSSISEFLYMDGRREFRFDGGGIDESSLQPRERRPLVRRLRPAAKRHSTKPFAFSSSSCFPRNSSFKYRREISCSASSLTASRSRTQTSTSGGNWVDPCRQHAEPGRR